MGNRKSVLSSKSKVEVPPTNFVTGIDVEEESFTWTISNFNVIRMHKPLINDQIIYLSVKEPTGHRAQWTASLWEFQQTIGKRWIWIHLRPSNSDPTNPTVYSQFRFTVKNKQGEVIKESDTGLMYVDTANDAGKTSWFSPTDKSIDADDADLCPEDDLVIHIAVKVYTLSQPKLRSSLEVIKEKFQVTFLEQFRKDFDDVLKKSRDPSTDIKIIANDGKKFTMQKGILAVRSEVFAAMLKSNMVETNSGVINLPDISSDALQVLLNFLATGKLLPEWRDAEVLPELTNAAAKYQLQDLLQFLDLTIGKVCQVENVKPLLILARQLPLKVAEGELMTFVKREGVGSADNFIQICLTGDESDMSRPKVKRRKWF